MRSRILFGVLMLAAIGALVARTAAEASLKWAVVNLTETTVIAGTMVAGPVVFLHDDDKMVRGEPCTSVHQFSPVKGVGEVLVAFHCKPRFGTAPDKFTTAITRVPSGPRVLAEYQFAGDTEAHGVPAQEKQTAAAHDMKDMKGMPGMHCANCAKDMKCGDDCKDCKDCKDCTNCKK